MAEPTFEKDLERLEAIVAALEQGGLSLDEALKRFEEGVKLAKRCERALTSAEQKIEMLVKAADGTVETVPFGGEAAGNGTETPQPAEAPAPPDTGSETATRRRRRTESDGTETEEGDGEEGALLF